MEDNTNSLITVNASIAKIDKQIAIGEKIIFNEIELIFDEAFYLINSKHIETHSEKFYFQIKYNSQYLKKNRFKYVAKSNQNYVQAIELFTKIIFKEPSFKYAHYFRAVANNEIFNYLEAISDLTKAIEYDANFISAYSLRGQLFAKLEKNDLAINDYDIAISLDSNNSEFYHERANSKFRINKRSSMGDYNKAIDIDSHNIRAYNNRGRTLKSIGKIEDSKRDFESVIDSCSKELFINESDENLYYYSGWAKYQLELFSNAILDFTCATEINPEFLSAYNSRGDTKSKLFDHVGAIEDYSMVIKINPKERNIYYRRANEKMKVNDFKGAIEDFSLEIKLNEYYSNDYFGSGIINKVSLYLRGGCKFRLKKYKGAIEDFSMVIKIDENHSDAYHNRGVAKRKLNDYEGAKIDMNKCKELKKTNFLNK